jgi:hypothetical protein
MITETRFYDLKLALITSEWYIRDSFGTEL